MLAVFNKVIKKQYFDLARQYTSIESETPHFVYLKENWVWGVTFLLSKIISVFIGIP